MNNDIYLRNLCADCVRSANNLTIAIQRAWDTMVDEFEQDVSAYIEQNPLKYNLLERAQFVFQVKDNVIEQQITARSKALDELLEAKLNDFEQKANYLVLNERQEWLSQSLRRDRLLRNRELQFYQELIEYLTEGLQLPNVSDTTKFADPLCELIATYVFDIAYPMKKSEIIARFNSLWDPIFSLMAALTCVSFVNWPETHGFIGIASERIKVKPEEIWSKVSNENMKRLNTRCRDYIESACCVYRSHANDIQEWIDKKLNKTLDAVE